MPKVWIPLNNKVLENNAETAVKCLNNCIINAGPGAGKSELLIQKAFYILSTIEKHTFSKILSISFTRSAARNIKQRVEKNFPSDLQNRVVSTTFDAFCISIYNQFKFVLDDCYIVDGDFEPDNTPYWSFQTEFENFSNAHIKTNYPIAPDYRQDIQWPLVNIYFEDVKDPIDKEMLTEYIKYKVKHRSLTFEIVKQLAYKILMTNSQILRCLQETYPYIFVDEFQDTNFIQYSILKIAFQNQKNKITCVGDKKQCIYAFAGAKASIFDTFKNDFSATEIILRNNYRSESSVVKLVNSIGHDLDAKTSNSISKVKDSLFKEQKFLIFDYIQDESVYISETIKKLLAEKVKPREIVIFGKQKIGDLAMNLHSRLITDNIPCRFEESYSHFTEDAFFRFVFYLVILAVDKNVNAFNYIIDIYEKIFDDSSYKKIESDLKKIRCAIKDNNNFEKIIYYIMDLFNLRKYTNIFTILSRTTIFENRLKFLDQLIGLTYKNPNDLLSKINEMFGEDSIPIMTIHKSKGLEYDSIFFMGFENSQFYNLKPNSEEERLIFVAISRAKRNVYLTLAKERNIRYGRYVPCNETLRGIITLLNDNGLEIEKYNE